MSATLAEASARKLKLLYNRHFREQYGLALQPHLNSSLLALAASGKSVHTGLHTCPSFCQP